MDKAQEMGTSVVIIPGDAKEITSQIKSAFGGISGILRWR